MHLEEFDAVHQRLLVHLLATILDVAPTDIVISSVEEGSVKVTLDIPEGAVERLRQVFEKEPSILEEGLRPFRCKAFEFITGKADVASSADKLTPMERMLEVEMTLVVASLPDRYYDALVQHYQLGFPLRDPANAEKVDPIILRRATHRLNAKLGEIVRSQLEGKKPKTKTAM